MIAFILLHLGFRMVIFPLVKLSKAKLPHTMNFQSVIKQSIALVIAISLFSNISLANSNGETITIAVASNFAVAMKKIVAQFEKESGHQVKIASASSGKIAAQIINGAPFYAFFSADQAKVATIEDMGLTVKSSRFTYAVGTLALWSLQNDLDVMNLLKEGQFNKLAIANSKLAPYGLAGEQALENLGLAASTRNKWVRGESIAQTFQFASSANAKLGLVALSQIMVDGKITRGSVWIVPAHLHQPIKQDAALLQKGKNSQATLALLQFVQSQKAQLIMQSFGYKAKTAH